MSFNESVVGQITGVTFSFGVVDYVVFIVMLCASAGIGIYFGFFAKGSDTTDEYLMGGKKMKTLPIAISLVASQLSGIAIMAIPAELYGYGINYIVFILSMTPVVPVLCYVVVPVFYNNNISNCYEYLERRFNRSIRQIITWTFIFTVLLYLPVFMFVPSLAFSQVTGVNIHLINAIVCSICIFYTMLGGIKAVVWTDVVQCGVMVGSTILIAFIGMNKAGGIDAVIENASNGGRLDILYDLDPRTRTTVWNCMLGGFCMWSSYVGFNQSCVQRIVALPTLSNARHSLYFFGIGFFIIMLLSAATGIIMYAYYHGCDPTALKFVDKPDKMMPYFVQDIVGEWKGLPGMFISCVFSASLSSISANMNSLSGIFYFDFIKPYIRHTERKANHIMKTIVFVLGIYCVAGGLVVEQFKSIMQLVVTISGISHGTVVGIFMLGLLVPRVRGKAALASLVASIIMMFILVGGSQLRMKSGHLKYDTLPTTADECLNLNSTAPTITRVTDKEFSIFEISFFWFAFLGGILVWLFGIPLSYLIPSDEKLDPALLSPVIRWWVKPDRTFEEVPLKCAELKVQTHSE